MNVYHELLELLSPRREALSPVLFGTLTGIEPPEVTLAGTAVSRGLVYPRGMKFYEEDLGAEVALLPREGGFMILFLVEGDMNT